MKKLLLITFILLLIFNFANAQKHGFAIIEPSLNVKSDKKLYPGISAAGGARIANSFIHLGFGISALIAKNEHFSPFGFVSIVDDKATKITPVAFFKVGKSGYRQDVGYTATEGQLFFSANAGVLLPSKVKGKVMLSLGFGRINYATVYNRTSTKSSTNLFSLCFGLKFQ